jgi:hypothetical protein
MGTTLLDTVGIWVSLILTLVVFSYLLGDNVLYRLAEHLFVGVAVGYAAVVAFHSVLVPKLFQPLMDVVGSGDWYQLPALLVPLLLGLFFLTKPFKRARLLSWLGNFSVATLLGVGAALAISGALLGTLLPQVSATSNVTQYTARYGPALGFVSGIVVLVGTAGVLLTFHFGTGGETWLARLRGRVVRTWGGIGRWFILIAFGAILATTFVSRLSLLVGRIQFIINSLGGLIGG